MKGELQLDTHAVQVSVLPSGHRYCVQGNDNLLQAGLKAGLPLPYGCGSGNCGLCKARLLSGELRQVSHSDLHLTEQEKQEGIRLLCTHTAVTDVVVETFEAAGPADIPWQEIVARVRSVAGPGAGRVYSLHVQTPRSHRLRFLAGQSVTLALATPQGECSASVALASCPCDERNLHFHVAADGGTEVSRWIREGLLAVGTEISVRGPFGDFVLESSLTDDPVFVTSGTGFAPVKSLIEHAIALDCFKSLSLYCLSKTGAGHYAENLCRSWARSLDNFRYVGIEEPDLRDGARQLVARIFTDQLALGFGRLYVAGESPFADAVEATWMSAGQNPERVRCYRLP